MINLAYNTLSIILAIISSAVSVASFIFTFSLLGIIIFGLFIEASYKRKNIKCFEEVKKVLSNEYAEIKIGKLGFPYKFSNDDIKCMAKLDENNNIVYKIQIDTEITSDSYITFTDHFEV